MIFLYSGSGCSAVWVAYLNGVQAVAGSNPVIPTRIIKHIGRLAQLGERLPYKQVVGGSSPSTPTIIKDSGSGWSFFIDTDVTFKKKKEDENRLYMYLSSEKKQLF